jgi:sodium transport system permease protein
MLERIGVIFRKEILDNLRDRRTLAGSLFYPLLGPLLIVLLFSVIGRTVSEQIEKPLDLPVQGSQHAPSLIQFLEQNDVVIQPAPADPRAEVIAGDLDIVLIIPESYGEDFTAGRPATVQLVYDDSRQSSSPTVNRTRNLLQAFAQQVAAQRLLGRGINPAALQVLAVERLDVSTPQSQAANLLNLTPYFIIFSVFMGGMYLAIDTTAGERERGTLEPLLINPVTSSELVLGKLSATLVFTVLAVVETLIGFMVVLNVPAMTDLVGVRISLAPAAMVAAFLITIPIMLLAAALQIVIATFTRSFKEAQNILGLVPLIPALPGMFLAFVPYKTELWAMLIPTFGQQLLIIQVMRGEAPNPLHLVVSAGVTLLVGLGLVWLAIRLYDRERILFGKK